MKLERIQDVYAFISEDMNSNIYLIDDLIIDAGIGNNFEEVRETLKKIGKKSEDIKKIIITHTHIDHIGGLKFFPNAQIYVHEKEAGVIEKADKQKSLALMMGEELELEKRKVFKKLKEGDEIIAGKHKLKVIETFGHTIGGICLYDKENKILFSGDTIFAEGIGRTDFPGGNSKELKKSLEKLSKLDIEIILPGHGEIVKKEGNKVIKKALNEFENYF